MSDGNKNELKRSDEIVYNSNISFPRNLLKVCDWILLQKQQFIFWILFLQNQNPTDMRLPVLPLLGRGSIPLYVINLAIVKNAQVYQMVSKLLNENFKKCTAIKKAYQSKKLYMIEKGTLLAHCTPPQPGPLQYYNTDWSWKNKKILLFLLQIVGFVNITTKWYYKIGVLYNLTKLRALELMERVYIIAERVWPPCRCLDWRKRASTETKTTVKKNNQQIAAGCGLNTWKGAGTLVV